MELNALDPSNSIFWGFQLFLVRNIQNPKKYERKRKISGKKLLNIFLNFIFQKLKKRQL